MKVRICWKFRVILIVSALSVLAILLGITAQDSPPNFMLKLFPLYMFAFLFQFILAGVLLAFGLLGS